MGQVERLTNETSCRGKGSVERVGFLTFKLPGGEGDRAAVSKAQGVRRPECLLSTQSGI